jgi:hypothetical protein
MCNNSRVTPVIPKRSLYACIKDYEFEVGAGKDNNYEIATTGRPNAKRTTVNPYLYLKFCQNDGMIRGLFQLPWGNVDPCPPGFFR